MSGVVSLHPVLTTDLMQKLGFQVIDYLFEYDDGVGKAPLVTESITGQEHVQSRLHLKDESDIWNSETHNLHFLREVFIANPSHLFGPKGIAGTNAEIGIAVMWASRQSSQRGVFTGDSIRLNSDKNVFAIRGEFSPGVLRDSFTLSTILYLKSTGLLQDDERHLASVAGTSLGELGVTTFHLAGNGSFFPIFTLREDGPLWRVECNWEDSRTDFFDEDSVKIILNEKHADFKHTVSPDGEGFTPLMKEIVSSAIQIIIENVLKDVSFQDVMSGKGIDRGSVCSAVRYFIDTFDLDTSSKENLSYTLRKFLDRKVGGIA